MPDQTHSVRVIGSDTWEPLVPDDPIHVFDEIGNFSDVMYEFLELCEGSLESNR
jgi:hypothetical protein